MNMANDWTLNINKAVQLIILLVSDYNYIFLLQYYKRYVWTNPS